MSTKHTPCFAIRGTRAEMERAKLYQEQQGISGRIWCCTRPGCRQWHWAPDEPAKEAVKK